MSVLGDLFGGFRQIILLDERVTNVERDVDAMKGQLNKVAGRVARLEGMLEMAMYQEQRRIDRD